MDMSHTGSPHGPGGEASDPPAGHGMAVVGDKAIFLSHLPMFMVPHNRQFILEAGFRNGSNGVDDIYLKDNQLQLPGARINELFRRP